MTKSEPFLNGTEGRKKPQRKLQRKPYSPVKNSEALFEPDRLERVEKRAMYSMIALTALTTVLGPNIDTPTGRRRLGLQLHRLWEEITPMNPRERQLVEQLQEAATGEAPLPQSTARTKLLIEAASGTLSEQEIASAAQEYEQRLDAFSVQTDSNNPRPFFDAVVGSFGEYDETHSFATDLLNGNGGNCEARAYYACGMVEDAMPELTPRVSIETLWVENEHGELTPHVRCVVVNDDGTITPLEGSIQPERTEALPPVSAQTELARAFLSRHNALPMEATPPAEDAPTIPKKEDGTDWRISDTVTDSLLLHRIAGKVQRYKPGVVDNAPKNHEPIQVVIHHMPHEEWEAIARDPNHPKRKEVFHPKTEQQGEEWRPAVLTTAREVQLYVADHYLGPVTPLNIRLTSPEAHQEFKKYVTRITAHNDMVVVPEWATEEYDHVLFEQLTTGQEGKWTGSRIIFTGDNAGDAIYRYIRFRADDGGFESYSEKDDIYVRNIQRLDPELLTVQVYSRYTIDVLSENTLNTLLHSDFLERYIQEAMREFETSRGKKLAIQPSSAADFQALQQKIQRLQLQYPDTENLIQLLHDKQVSPILTTQEFEFYIEGARLTPVERTSHAENFQFSVRPVPDQVMETFIAKQGVSIQEAARVYVGGGTSPEAAKRLLDVFLQGEPTGLGKELSLYNVTDRGYLRALHTAGVGESLRVYKSQYPEYAPRVTTSLNFFGSIPAHTMAALILEECVSPLELEVKVLYKVNPDDISSLFSELAIGLNRQDMEAEWRGHPTHPPATIVFSNPDSNVRITPFNSTVIQPQEGDTNEYISVTVPDEKNLDVGLEPNVPRSVIVHFERDNAQHGIEKSLMLRFTVVNRVPSTSFSP